ncbi:MAG: ACBP60 family protein [Cytophagales bacterium]|jgi:hypothetical protein|nr:ACBP60 family protein [Cytophagales bacterium]
MNRICVVCSTPIFGQKQKYCSNTCKQKDHYHRVKSQTNTYHSQTLRSISRKAKLVQMFGGGCQKCGYNANLSALHFHHKNPTSKSFKLDARVLSNKKWDCIVEEAKKCCLLCSNCHSEEHNPELSMNNIQRILGGAALEESRDGMGVNSGKP